MALACGEHEHEPFMAVGTPIYGALNPATKRPDDAQSDWMENVAFCERGLRQIPEDERFAEEQPDGINIHTATSKPNGPGSEVYCFSELKYGRRLFSISRAAFIRHMPEAAAKLLG